jgi:hypothetical protein
MKASWSASDCGWVLTKCGGLPPYRRSPIRKNGTKLGRRRVKPSVEATIRELRAKGDGILKIARALGVGTSVVQRVVLETS